MKLLSLINLILKISARLLTKINTEDRFGYSPLTLAAKTGNQELVEMLIEKGAELNPKGNKGIHPLRGAFTAKHWELATWMIEKGAKMSPQSLKELQDSYHATPLDLANKWGFREIADLFKPVISDHPSLG